MKYRNDFVDCYFEYELLAHRWISITEEERNKKLKKGNLSENLGFKYEKDGKFFYKYHVDDSESFCEKCATLPFGGNLSVRKPADKRAIMMICQDEAIVKQNLTSLLAWTLPDGLKALIPKDNGAGAMISGFTSRKLGFEYSVPQHVLDEVNKIREGTKYSDVNAARILFNKETKPKLTSSPFICKLEYGQNRDGYWMYDHMVIQFKDCIDVLKYLHPDFDFVFFFNHSNSHDRLQPDGLSLNKTSVRHSGKQSAMRDSIITKSLLGPFHTKDYPL